MKIDDIIQYFSPDSNCLTFGSQEITRMGNLTVELNKFEDKKEEMYSKVVEAANYVSDHTMMHYGGQYETTELFLPDEELTTRLEETVENIETVRDRLVGKKEEMETRVSENDSISNTIQQRYQQAKKEFKSLNSEFQYIRDAMEGPPEEKADQEYVEEKETEARSLTEEIDYTPTREET